MATALTNTMNSILQIFSDPMAEIPDTSIGWPRLLSSTGTSWLLDFVFHAIILITIFTIIGIGFVKWHNNVFQQDPPSATLMAGPSTPDASMNADIMVNYQVATATYGGIYTEQGRPHSNYSGRVDHLAVAAQITAGMRALIFDVWPNPSAPTQPCVVAMEQIQTPWYSPHFTSGVTESGYSNWKMLTRPTSEDLLSLMNEVAATAPVTDPFFVILNLHGAMTVPYLNIIGVILDTAFSGRHMPVEYAKAAAPAFLCTAPVSVFVGNIFIIANIVVDPAFVTIANQTDVTNGAMTATKFAEQVNLLSVSGFPPGSATSPTQNVYSVQSSASISSKTATCQGTTGPTATPFPSATFCVIQPSTGGLDTTNDTLYADSSFSTCLATGAQFVGINVFDQATGSATQSVFNATFSTSGLRKKGT